MLLKSNAQVRETANENKHLKEIKTLILIHTGLDQTKTVKGTVVNLTFPSLPGV